MQRVATRPTPRMIRLGGAVVCLATAVALLPALRDERRLESADRALGRAPDVALRESAGAAGPATRSHVAATSIAALVRLGDLPRAEAIARTDVGAHPDDAYAVRRLYAVQLLRYRRVAARRTLERLRELDPRFAAGIGL